MMARLKESEVYKWFDVFKGNSQLTEIRLIANDGKTASGYFTDAAKIIEAVRPYSDDYNIYFTVNSVNPECYGRVQRDVIVQRPKNTTTDNEIVGRDWVYLDLDSRRIAGTNATDEQVEYTKKKANDVYRFLKDNGFNEPVVVFSGNGVHLYIRCALKPTEENNTVVKRFIQSLGMIFSDDRVDIDQKVFNLGRISRMPGTWSCKGSKRDSGKPQRLCEIVRVPKEVKANSIEYFRKIADLYPEDDSGPRRDNNYSTERFDLEAFIARHNIPVVGKQVVADGTRYYLEHCLFNEQHKGKDAILFQRNNGAVAYFCYHNSCASNDWRKVRLMYEPDAYSHRISDIPRRKEYYERRSEFKPLSKEDDKGEIWLKMSQVRRPDFCMGDYIPSGIRQIDDLIIGFKRKHVTVWSGYRGSAKTTILNMLVLNAANNGYKSAMWTGELADDEVKRWLYLQAAGKTYNRNVKKDFYVTPDNICSMIDPWIDRYFWLFNNAYGNNFSQIVDKITELTEQEGLDMVVLDNLMVLDINDLDGDRNEKQKNLMYTLTVLAKKLNIHIHIVAHPNKSGTFLRPNNISGSGHIPDLAQNVIIAHRVNQDFEANAREFLPPRVVDEILYSRCTNCLEICKCRDKGSAADHFIELYYEIESNRLKNDVAEHIHYGWEEMGEQTEIDYEDAEDMPDFL